MDLLVNIPTWFLWILVITFFTFLVLAWLIVRPFQDSGSLNLANSASENEDCKNALEQQCKVGNGKSDIVTLNKMGVSILISTSIMFVTFLGYMMYTRRTPFDKIGDMIFRRTTGQELTSSLSSEQMGQTDVSKLLSGK